MFCVMFLLAWLFLISNPLTVFVSWSTRDSDTPVISRGVLHLLTYIYPCQWPIFKPKVSNRRNQNFDQGKGELGVGAWGFKSFNFAVKSALFYSTLPHDEDLERMCDFHIQQRNRANMGSDSRESIHFNACPKGGIYQRTRAPYSTQEHYRTPIIPYFKLPRAESHLVTQGLSRPEG